ncbi:hypothetical protein QP028_15030 [Corynebacterium suedekumii]|nr:hypothetical protein QP028_15030 [Corynebacterium suedekumii]
MFSHLISDDEADVFVEARVHEVSQLWPNVTNEASPALLRRGRPCSAAGAVHRVALMEFGSLSGAVAALHLEDGDFDAEAMETDGRLLQPG